MMIAAEFFGDREIAAAARALVSSRGLSHERVHVEVRDGWITLEGEVEWLHERAEAGDAMRRIAGAAGYVNLICVNSPHA